jgi:DNA-directed RNA polymerase subunit N (RpoN/RPB10)
MDLIVCYVCGLNAAHKYSSRNQVQQQQKQEHALGDCALEHATCAVCLLQAS